MAKATSRSAPTTPSASPDTVFVVVRPGHTIQSGRTFHAAGTSVEVPAAQVDALRQRGVVLVSGVDF